MGLGHAMHVISRKKLVTFWQQYPDAEEPLAGWFKVAEKAKWTKWADVQSAYPKASYFECCLIFNICGGKFRLILKRSVTRKTLFVVGVYTHKEYDLDRWKEYCSCP